MVEVARPNRADRHRRGKCDVFDAENAARAVLAGQARAIPKADEGIVEMIRHLKIAKDAAVKARSAAMSIKAMLITALPSCAEALELLPDMALLRRCAALRLGELTSVTATAKHSLRAIAQRWQHLHAEITSHQHQLKIRRPTGLPTEHRGGYRPRHGLRTADRPRTKTPGACTAKPPSLNFCGACPIPASSGTTTRHRLQPGRSPPGQRRAAPHRHRPDEIPRPHPRLRHSTHHGRQTKPEIMRCLKRAITREIWARTQHLRQTTPQPLDAL